MAGVLPMSKQEARGRYLARAWLAADETWAEFYRQLAVEVDDVRSFLAKEPPVEVGVCERGQWLRGFMSASCGDEQAH